MTRIKRKKLNLGVKKQFQYWLLIRFIAITVFCALIAALILYFYARTEITSSFFDAHIKIRRVSDLLLPVVIAGSLVSLVCGIVLTLFIPQKIAGPIFRIEQDLKSIQQGDLRSQVKLRSGDILTDLAGEVNKATARTRNRVQTAKDALADLVETLADIPADDKVQKRIETLQDSLEKLQT